MGHLADAGLASELRVFRCRDGHRGLSIRALARPTDAARNFGSLTPITGSCFRFRS